MMSSIFFKFFYVLLLLLLHAVGSVTGNNRPSKSGEVKCIERERQALLSFQQDLSDDSGMLSTWRDDYNNRDCCTWQGIECSNETGHVLKLHLRGRGTQYLFGRIDISSLIYLQNLEHLDLSWNDFLGIDIPELVGSFIKLRYLNLSNSEVGGSIPYQLGNVSKLEYLDVNHNYLEGAIPPQLGKLAHLKYLNLGNNYLDGGIPHQLRNLQQLQYLDLRGNNLSGAIPFQNGNLPMLHTLKLGGELDLNTKDIEWLSNISSLINLHLSSLHLSYSHHWLQMISKHIPNLRELRLTDCGLSDNDIQSLFDSHSNVSTSLAILDLSSNILTSSTFQLLFNFSFNLQELYLSHNNLVWSGPLYPNFPSLVILDLSYNNLTSSIFQGNFNFSSRLEKLYLKNCNLTDRSFLMPSASIMNSSSSLVGLDLSYNLLTSSTIFHLLFNFYTNLHSLDLSYNLLDGPIPDGIGKVMNSLEDINLSNNKLHGKIPTSFGNVCSLQTLYLSYNNLSGDISRFIQNSSWCNRRIFHALDLSHNRIIGILPKSIGLLSELEELYLVGNSLEGEITESHLNNFSKLIYLDLSYNSFSLKFALSWVPPFRLLGLGLASCKLGPSFPSWLQTQSHLVYLDISNAGINDSVPEWLWNNLEYIELVWNMSYNNFIGTIPNLPVKLPWGASIYLNSNQFEGAIPSFLRQASMLFLSENKFSDLFSLLCDNNTTAILDTLDLSFNQIKGQLPNCWESVNSLLFLDLSNNNISGKIPLSIGTLTRLKALVLRNNSLIGKLPSTLKNYTNLIVLDVGENFLSGPIPSWIGESLRQLIILSMSSNHFSGNLPMHLCYLRQIQLLDLSRNNLSNGIPICIKNFTALSRMSINTSETLHHIYQDNITYMEINDISDISGYELNIVLMWKGELFGFKDPELSLKSIDLSSNHLTGKIPQEFGYLVGLFSLNLSRNNLSGEIPSNIGNLTSLNFLDLSENHLSGKIPSTLSQIDGLGVLDLSNNSLSGRIPFGRHLQTFGASSFEGNLNLCGEQLNKSCPEDTTPVKPQRPTAHDKDNNSAFYEAFYMSMGLGFFTGFCSILGLVLLWRPWRNAHLNFLNKLTEYIYTYV